MRSTPHTSCLARPINESCPSRTCFFSTPCLQRLSCAQPISRPLALAAMGTALAATANGRALWGLCTADAANASRWSSDRRDGPSPVGTVVRQTYSSVLMWCASRHLLKRSVLGPPDDIDWRVLRDTPFAGATGPARGLTSGKVQLHIPSVGAVGFWARAYILLAHAIWALSVGVGVTTATMQADPSDPYVSDTAVHPWLQTFSPVGASGGAGSALQLDCAAGAMAYHAFKPYRANYNGATEARVQAADLVERLGIAPSPAMAMMASSFWAHHFEPGQQVLGIHLRGTDARRDGSRSPASRFVLRLLVKFVGLARSYVRSHPGATIFVASDEAPLLQQLRQRLSPHARVVWRQDATHSADTLPVHLPPRVDGRRSALAADAMLETLLLSRCSFLLKAQSALSEWSIYWNPGLRNASFDAGLKGQPLPEWAR